MYKYRMYIDNVMIVEGWFEPKNITAIEDKANYIKSKLKDGVKFDMDIHYPVR